MKTPWNEKTLVQKILFVAAIAGSAVAVFLLAFAATTFFTNRDTKLPNTRDSIEFTIDMTDVKDQAQAVKPGTEQSITTTITNEWDKSMYLFVRVSCDTYGEDEKPIYSFTPNSSWIPVEVEDAGQLVFAYTDGGTDMVAIESEDSVVFSGTLKCVITKKAFGEKSNADMEVLFRGCALGTDADGTSPASVYGQYKIGAND